MTATTSTVTKINSISKRNIVIVTIVSIVLTLSCLFYVAHTNDYYNYYYNAKSSSGFLSNYSALNQDARPSYKKDKTSLTCVSNTALVGNGNVTKEEWQKCLDAGGEPQYYLSIIIVTRVDDYAGNQHHRFQNFIDSAYLLAEHSEQKIELLIIEWNPPTNRRRIVDAFRFRRSKYLNHRIITVSNKIHEILPNKGNAPLHEFEGKNVGIRFARGEYIVCTNQDDIWSHNFINAVRSRVFEKDIIYTQFQAAHNIHENLPPSIVNLPPFPTDDIIYNACKLGGGGDWGNYRLPAPVPKSIISHENYWYYGDQAGDFTMAHRDTWKDCRGYREMGGVAWMDIEFILTAVGTFNKQLIYSSESMSCHQEHPNEWERRPDLISEGQNPQEIDDILQGIKKIYNKKDQWALYNVDIWEQGLECFDFQGGLCY